VSNLNVLLFLDSQELSDSRVKCLIVLRGANAGSFASFDSFKGHTRWLWINQIGDVGLPLTALDAQAITQASHQAPFGLGEDIVVDTSVRKCREPNKDPLSFQNPEWNANVSRVLNTVKTEMGISCSLRYAHINCCYLRTGPFFLPHQE
jgi:hypothetical protein